MEPNNGGAVDEINALKQQVIELTKLNDDFKEINLKVVVQVEDLKADRDKWKRAYTDEKERHQKAIGEVTAWGEIVDKLLDKI